MLQKQLDWSWGSLWQSPSLEFQTFLLTCTIHEECGIAGETSDTLGILKLQRPMTQLRAWNYTILQIELAFVLPVLEIIQKSRNPKYIRYTTGVLINSQPEPTDKKKQFKYRQFSSDAEVIAAVETWLDGQPYEIFLSDLQKLQFGRCSLFSPWTG